MAAVVPSRFAKLKIVEDDFLAAQLKQQKLLARNNKEQDKNKVNQAGKKAKPPKEKAPKAAAPLPGTGAREEGGGGGGGGGWQVKKKRRAASSAQWEEWKERDSAAADGSFQDDMQQALLLSKLEFDAQKQSTLKAKVKDPVAVAESDEPPGASAGAAKQKQKKAKQPLAPAAPPQSPVLVGGREPPSLEEIQGAALRGALQEARSACAALQAQLDLLKAELLKVKTRNKKLCNIIGQGEMKDKAQVLMETENLREVQAELNAEVAALNTTLQQERSRCSCANRQDKKKRPPAAASERDKET